jgi:hypothetical protein
MEERKKRRGKRLWTSELKRLELLLADCLACLVKRSH